MRHKAFAVAAVLLAALPAPASGARDDLRDRPFTVVAVVDTGINPYHEDFRRPELTAHPSTYIEGFPKSAPAVPITFGEAGLTASAQTDAAAWDEVEPNELVWLPGTNVVGAIGPFDFTNPTGLGDGITAHESGHPVLDLESGHGTAVASVAGGAIHGPDTEDTLLVAVKGNVAALEWAAKQPWIDIVTLSWWNLRPGDLRAVADASRAAVASGKVVCVANMNYSAPMFWTASNGPSWNVYVGAASKQTRGEHYYTGYPNDVLGLAGVMAATADANSGEQKAYGTSVAAPNVCGLHAKVLSEVRGALGDVRQGARPSAVARGPRGDGYLSDGRLTRAELEDAVASTATPAVTAISADDRSIPAAPVVPWIRGGYGIVDEDSARTAVRVITGRIPRPDRLLEDSWLAAVDAIRDALWGPPPP
ncbi:MAG: S8/S53 family peptidase [Actinomycetota bacterium]|nr:S8/S53 family peptidase [Actinomycetota bacterium]